MINPLVLVSLHYQSAYGESDFTFRPVVTTTFSQVGWYQPGCSLSTSHKIPVLIRFRFYLCLATMDYLIINSSRFWLHTQNKWKLNSQSRKCDCVIAIVKFTLPLHMQVYKNRDNNQCSVMQGLTFYVPQMQLHSKK